MRPACPPLRCLPFALALALALTVTRAPGEEERIIALKDAPAAVREAVAQQFPAAAISTIEVEVRDGRTVYEAEITSNGAITTIKLDEHGKLLKTRIKKAAPDNDGDH